MQKKFWKEITKKDHGAFTESSLIWPKTWHNVRSLGKFTLLQFAIPNDSAALVVRLKNSPAGPEEIIYITRNKTEIEVESEVETEQPLGYYGLQINVGSGLENGQTLGIFSKGRDETFN